MVSKLATYTRYTKHYTEGRNGRSVDTITIHCTAGNKNSTAKSIVDYFADTDRNASSNYCIGGDGSIGCSVDEVNRAWTSGGAKTVDGETGSQNDYHAITFEVASDTTGKQVNDKAIESTIALCIDICKRYGKNKAVWFGDNASKMVSYKAADNEMKFTWHRWFANKACPGEAIMNKFQYIIDSINKGLATVTATNEFVGLSEKDAAAKIGEICKEDMKKSGVLASLSAAQFILESGFGKSELAVNANNVFGMKKSLSGNTWSGSTWDGVSIYTKKTMEQNPDGSVVEITADFRKYGNISDSVADHSAYLKGAKNGNALRYPGIDTCRDYKTACQIVKDGGYATSLTYVNSLISLIERFNLTQYDVTDRLYRVQVGAFSIKKNAENTLAKAKKIASDAFIVQERGLYKVQVGAFSVKKNAENMVEICKNNGFTDAFIKEVIK